MAARKTRCLPEISCETREIRAGLKSSRASPEDLIVCSNIGMSVCEVLLGREIFYLAPQRGGWNKTAVIDQGVPGL